MGAASHPAQGTAPCLPSAPDARPQVSRGPARPADPGPGAPLTVVAHPSPSPPTSPVSTPSRPRLTARKNSHDRHRHHRTRLPLPRCSRHQRLLEAPAQRGTTVLRRAQGALEPRGLPRTRQSLRTPCRVHRPGRLPGRRGPLRRPALRRTARSRPGHGSAAPAAPGRHPRGPGRRGAGPGRLRPGEHRGLLRNVGVRLQGPDVGPHPGHRPGRGRAAGRGGPRRLPRRRQGPRGIARHRTSLQPAGEPAQHGPRHRQPALRPRRAQLRRRRRLLRLARRPGPGRGPTAPGQLPDRRRRRRVPEPHPRQPDRLLHAPGAVRHRGVPPLRRGGRRFRPR